MERYKQQKKDDKEGGEKKDKGSKPRARLLWPEGADKGAVDTKVTNARGSSRVSPDHPSYDHPFYHQTISLPSHNEQVGATFLVRDMVNMPTECMGPAQIQRVGELLAAKFGGKAKTIVGDDLLKVCSLVCMGGECGGACKDSSSQVGCWVGLAWIADLLTYGHTRYGHTTQPDRRTSRRSTRWGARPPRAGSRGCWT